MAKQSIIHRFEINRPKNHARPEIPESGNGFARPEAVARALGYTEKQEALAMDVLQRFTWRHSGASSAAQPSEEDASDREAEKRDPDDLEAAS